MSEALNSVDLMKMLCVAVNDTITFYISYLRGCHPFIPWNMINNYT